MKYKEVFEMPNELFTQFWQAITVIEARDMLLQMSIADYPHGKKDSRSKLHKKISKMAYPRMDERTSEEKMKDAFKILSGVARG